jgi:hypothetical protein
MDSDGWTGRGGGAVMFVLSVIARSVATRQSKVFHAKAQSRKGKAMIFFAPSCLCVKYPFLDCFDSLAMTSEGAAA